VVGIDIIDELAGEGPDGSPEANAWTELNEVADFGGVPKNGGVDPNKFYNAANEIELQAALDEIAGQVQNCTIDLTVPPNEPPAEEQIPYVTFEDEDGVEIPELGSCDEGDGWAWIEVGLVLEICGSYCEDFKGGATIDGTYGCPGVG
jgi:hypothetical protein